MDMWTDPNLIPYMAVTAHWIQAKPDNSHISPGPPLYRIGMRADLIGFVHVPGKHDGKHLCLAFYYILERLGIQSKVSI